MSKRLTGQVAVVAGATRGAGRGIARMLGEQGATVYCSGRSVRGKRIIKTDSPFAVEGRSETIDETAEMVTALGGTGIPAQTDHSDENQVRTLFDRVRRDHGRLDILVNDIWGAEELSDHGKPFWEVDPIQGWTMMERAVRTHLITSRHGVPLMVEKKRGLVVEVTDGDHFSYRTALYYDLVKMSVIRVAFAMALELRPHNIASVAVTPGFLRSEAMLELMGVTPENWQEGAKKDPHFAHSETPALVGRGVAALAADAEVMRWSGKVVASWTLARLYGFSDEDGRTPDWGTHFETSQEDGFPAIREEMHRAHDAYIHMGRPLK